MDVLRSLLASGEHALLPDQLVVEFHFPHADASYRPKGAEGPQSHDQWQDRFADLLNRSSADAMAREMYARAGFAIVDHVRGFAPCCQELLFARTRCARG